MNVVTRQYPGEAFFRVEIDKGTTLVRTMGSTQLDSDMATAVAMAVRTGDVVFGGDPEEAISRMTWNPRPAFGILQPWVATLGLRHQGVLMAAVRGCDTEPKDTPCKELARVYRGTVLRAHCGDASKAVSFTRAMPAGLDDWIDLVRDAIKSMEALPWHYVQHLMGATEVLGYKAPNDAFPHRWHSLYLALCHVLHVNPETERQLDARLDADEVLV